MRDQYAGDITDFLKFSYLRAVVLPQSKLGIAWYYIPTHDGSRDGCHVEYQREKNWRDLDSDLFDQLGQLNGQRSIAALRRLRIWQSQTTFHDEPVEVRRNRPTWARRMVDALEACDVVFADPDNGLSREGVVSRKSATVQEIMDLAYDGRPVILIRFPSRKGTHLEQLQSHHLSLAKLHPVTVRTCVQVRNDQGKKYPRIRWFTLMNPSAEMRNAVGKFASRVRLIPGASAEVA